jgi:hypothetical protein
MLSHMIRAEYQTIRASIRTNGYAYASRQIKDRLVKSDISMLHAESLRFDWLAERVMFQKWDPKPVAFRLTSTLDCLQGPKG